MQILCVYTIHIFSFKKWFFNWFFGVNTLGNSSEVEKPDTESETKSVVQYSLLCTHSSAILVNMIITSIRIPPLAASPGLAAKCGAWPEAGWSVG